MRDELVAYVVDLVRAHARARERAGGRRAARDAGAAAAARGPTAALSGRDFVTPDDVRRMAVPVLEHRLILRPGVRDRGPDGARK